MMIQTLINVWKYCSKGAVNHFLKQEGFIFKGNKLCIPLCSLRRAVVQEAYGGGLVGHFRRDKTLSCTRKLLLAQIGS